MLIVCLFVCVFVCVFVCLCVCAVCCSLFVSWIGTAGVFDNDSCRDYELVSVMAVSAVCGRLCWAVCMFVVSP